MQGVEGVDDEIKVYLLKLHATAPYLRQMGGQVSDQADVSRNKLAVHDFLDLCNGPIEVHELEFALDLVLLEQRPQLLDHLAGAHVIEDDVGNDTADLRDVRRFLRQESLGSLSIAKDRGQGLAKLMGQGPGKFAEHGHAGEVRKLAPLLCHFDFRQLASGNVGDDAR